VNLEKPIFLVKAIMWLPWCMLLFTAVFLAKLPWWGVLLVAGFGWYDFMWTTVAWVAATLGTMLTGASWATVERTLISGLLVGIAAVPGLLLVKRAGLLETDEHGGAR
jgi:hypothetical protein